MLLYDFSKFKKLMFFTICFLMSRKHKLMAMVSWQHFRKFLFRVRCWECASVYLDCESYVAICDRSQSPANLYPEEHNMSTWPLRFWEQESEIVKFLGSSFSEAADFWPPTLLSHCTIKSSFSLEISSYYPKGIKWVCHLCCLQLSPELCTREHTRTMLGVCLTKWCTKHLWTWTFPFSTLRVCLSLL